MRAIAIAPNGDVYVGGDFASVGGVADTGGLARWDGATWSSVGGGVSGVVYALAIAPNGDLYVGGGMLSVGTGSGSLAVDRIARWDGATWHALGSGVNDSVLALTVDGSGTLFAGGAFSTAGGLAASGVARWNGSTWSALGAGLGTAVTSLVLGSGSTLYAGGWFAAGPAPDAYIAQWNGSTWSALGTGTSQAVYGLAFSGGHLYAVGAFSSAGGVSTGESARWDGSAWSALGGPLGGDVDDVTVASDGTVYVVGEFSVAGGDPQDGIAAWAGAGWESVGGGLNNQGIAVAASSQGWVVAGGRFTSAGGLPAARVARWTPERALSGSATAATAEFRFDMPDGVECRAMSPMRVAVGSRVTLPATSTCVTRGSDLVGWRIPGQAWAFAPGTPVYVVDSQQFTAVVREPHIEVEYDANVGLVDACLVAGADAGLEQRTTTSTVLRSDLGATRLGATAPCIPRGVRLAGWSDRPTTEGSDRVGPGGRLYAPGAPLPEEWRDGGTDPVNRIRLYAVWLPSA